jgi:hypothetical protein
MHEQGAFSTAAPILSDRPRKGVPGRQVRALLFGAALLLVWAVGISGCGNRMEEELEPLEQGEWLVLGGEAAGGSIPFNSGLAGEGCS